MLVVQALSCVLLEMQPGDADALGLALELDVEMAVGHDRPRILRDLIALRQIGIEIILAVEDRQRVDGRVDAEPGLHRLLDAAAIDHRQHARHAGIDRRHLAVRRGAEGGGRTREELGLGDHLGMDLEPDHDLPLAGAAVDQAAHARVPASRPARSGCSVKCASVSSTSAARKTEASSKARPMSCNPSGSPSRAKPAGIEMAGNPARLAGTVNTSFRYMAIGSSIFSPTAKAGVGAVGVSSRSTFSKAWSKSRAISARTFCAFR